jgi:hypothetical protein
MEIARAMRVETVIGAAEIWAAAPACPARKNPGPRMQKDRTRRNSFRITDVHSNNEQNRRALLPA